MIRIAYNHSPKTQRNALLAKMGSISRVVTAKSALVSRPATLGVNGAQQAAVLNAEKAST